MLPRAMSQIANKPHFLMGVVIFCFLLTVFSGKSFFTRIQPLLLVEKKIVAAEKTLPHLALMAKRRNTLTRDLQNANPHYLEQRLACLTLSRLEAYSLEVAKNELQEEQKTRLSFLMGSENSLHFLPGKVNKNPLFQVVEMKQAYPVEVDEKDIQRILAHIEGITIGSYAPEDDRPPMTIKKFSITRKKDTSQRFPSYLLDIELWQKEPTQNS